MKPIVLCILDGVGIRREEHGNAFKKACKPNFDYLWKNYPHSLLEASGPLVGLPKGQMGNSEVGHMNIGAGRIMYQPLELIQSKIKDGSFFENQVFKKVIQHTKDHHSKLHLAGLLSDGGIHSHINHLFALLDMCTKEHVEHVYLHLFLDGRDTLFDTAMHYINLLMEKLKTFPNYKIATISGRYYAMDRDNRWDRISKAYQAMTTLENEMLSIDEYIKKSYEEKIYDEFIEPATFCKEGLIENHDGIIVFNYRPDRLRELWKAFTNPEFTDFDRKFLDDLEVVTMMKVSEEVKSTPAFHLPEPQNILGKVLSDNGIQQLRIAETEKYAHVTYFFDGGNELDLKGVKKILIPSPKVATYDLKPSMSAYEITDTLLRKLDENRYDIVILNYANGDMVGHTGNMEASILSIEVLDECLGHLYQKVKEKNGILIVTADHGNCDTMLDEENHVVTSHSKEKVPFLITKSGLKLKDGKLGDIAPTILNLMQIEVPKEMTGNNLIVETSK